MDEQGREQDQTLEDTLLEGYELASVSGIIMVLWDGLHVKSQAKNCETLTE